MSSPEISPRVLMTLTGAVFNDFLGLELSEDVPQTDGGAVLYTAVIHVTGGFHGAVCLQVPEALAFGITQAMFMMESDEFGEEEVQDALGEVANMLAGSVKATVPETCNLSMPTVGTGHNYRLVVPGSSVLEQMACGCLGHPLSVTVLEQAVTVA